MEKNIFVINKGTIEHDAFHLLGATSKREDDTKIGYFGSGLKYAIAWMLRNSISFKVFSNAKEVKFDVKETEFRGKKIGVITVDGKKTSLTTDLGPDWTGWFALREIICNALDEEGGTYGFTSTAMQPAKDMTFFLIDWNDEFSDFVKNETKYFSFKRNDILCEVPMLGKIYPTFGAGEGLVVYRKGIQCYDSDQKCLFNYDFDDIEINESRVIKNTWQLRYDAFRLLNSADVATKRSFIERLKSDVYEWSLGIPMSCPLADDWLQAMEGYLVAPTWIPSAYLKDIDLSSLRLLPDWLFEAFENKFQGKLPRLHKFSQGRAEVEPDPYQLQLLDRAKEIITQVGLKVTFPVKFAIFRSALQMGEAHENTIYISPACIDSGLFETAATLLEEQFHLESNLGDETRGFQNFVFNKFLRELVKAKGILI